MGINNPLPSSLSSECKKCGKILTSFIDPRQSFGPDKIIPPQVLANAKGLAILTVFKAGFLGSARFGSGLVVARLPDGSWSAPSAIMTAGGGFGGQIGFELTDFVFILNDASAVKTFAQMGSITLGGNVSIAAGPVGRNAEAAGAASLKSVAGVFSYSKTKGLFAGVSLEGSAIIERKDANEKLYGQRLTAMQLLTGSVRPPPQSAPLMTVLNSRIFNGVRSGSMDDGMYNDVPVYEDTNNNASWDNNQGGAGTRAAPAAAAGTYGGSQENFGAPKRASTWQDDVYDRPSGSNPNRNSTGQFGADHFQAEKKAGPGRPAAPKPNFQSKNAMLKKNEAVALFTFEADQPGDLGFKKGDVITVLKKTDSANDWWTGMVGTRHGIFPSNYVKMSE
ncbi:SH3 domain-containing protein [Apiospora arundinis]|uniref:SH3 domain-containing protein n=1 Tax=Apiospora arundinis TaxID=335852 RepID=A0ABR2JNW9_9PEZI